MKAMLTETKENVQGTNSDRKETGTQINDVDQKEERNIQPEQKLDRRKHTPRHIITTLPKIKQKERILEAARKKGHSYLQRNSHKTVS